MSNKDYILNITLSEDNVLDREIIASLSRFPSDYAMYLIKAEILRWSKSANELTPLNGIALDLNQTLLSLSSPDEIVPEVVPEVVSGAKKDAAPVKEKKPVKLSFDDHVVESVLPGPVVDSLSISEGLKNKIRNSYVGGKNAS